MYPYIVQKDKNSKKQKLKEPPGGRQTVRICPVRHSGQQIITVHDGGPFPLREGPCYEYPLRQAAQERHPDGRHGLSINPYARAGRRSCRTAAFSHTHNPPQYSTPRTPCADLRSQFYHDRRCMSAKPAKARNGPGTHSVARRDPPVSGAAGKLFTHAVPLVWPLDISLGTCMKRRLPFPCSSRRLPL